MEPSSMHYFPLAWPWLLVLFALAAVGIAVVEMTVVASIAQRIGLHPRYVFWILLLSLLGSYINIPLAQLPPEAIVSDQVVEVYGVRYIVPAVERWPRTVIAVNMGGALIPVALAIYLVSMNRLYGRSLIAVAVIAFITHHWATPVRGVGITIPMFVPPLLASCVAMLLSWRRAPALAYVGGTLGTLIGADLLNLDKIRGLGAPIASIGGAGTFDGVFLTGIIAVLLLPLWPAGSRAAPSRANAPSTTEPQETSDVSRNE